MANPRAPKLAVLFGGTGQSIVVESILRMRGIRVVAVADDTEGLQSPFPDVPILPGTKPLVEWLRRRGPGPPIGFCVTIGNPHGRARLRIADALLGLGLVELEAIHPSAVVDPSAALGPGAQVMAGAVIQSRARIGRQCIVNTRASIDHESSMGDGSELGPGAVVCGSVRIGTSAWVAAGATVLPWITVGDDAIIGAGATAIEDVPPSTTVIGVPARPIRRGRA